MPEEIVEQVAQYSFSLASPPPGVTIRVDAAGAGADADAASANEDNDRFGLDSEDGRAQMQSEIPLQGVPQYGIHMNPCAKLPIPTPASNSLATLMLGAITAGKGRNGSGCIARRTKGRERVHS